jgi:hypothetical protein
MKTTLRRAATALAAATALVAGALGLAAPASAASLCATDCISYAPVSADTKTVRASVITTGYVNVTAEVWKADRTARVAYMYDAQPETWTNSWTFTSDSKAYLKQNTSYAVKIIAKDMLGKTWIEWRSVRIKQRTATWHITKINLTDDSDTFGAGEFQAGMKVGATVKTPIWSGWQSKSSGGSWTFASTNAATTLTRVGEISQPAVFLELLDSDVDPSDFGCGSGFAPAFDSGSNNCADWATAGAYVSLPETSATTSFTLYVNKNAVVKFTVQGYVTTTVA